MRARDRRRPAQKIEGKEGVGGTGAAPCQSWREKIQSAERSSVLDLVGQVLGPPLLVFWRPIGHFGQIGRKRTGAGRLTSLMTEIGPDRKRVVFVACKAGRLAFAGIVFDRLIPENAPRGGMNWYFALSATSIGSAGHDWPNLIRAAVISALRVTSLTPHLLWDGPEHPFLDELRALGVKIIHRRVSYHDDLAAFNSDPVYLATASGCFLRTEIPLVEDRQSYVLYTDADVVFLSDPVPALNAMRPGLFAAAGEFTFGDGLNSGVLLLNVAAMRLDYPGFNRFIRGNLALGLDQDMYRHYYAGRFESLPPAFNWKPYWGPDRDAVILHWHGIKPVTARQLLNDPAARTVPVLQRLVEQNPEGYRFYIDLFDSVLAQTRIPGRAGDAIGTQMRRRCQPHLIFDIGMSEGDDTEFYLAKGFWVVGVEPDVKTYLALRERFEAALQSGRLRIHNFVAGRHAGEIVMFHHHNEHPGLSGLCNERPEFAPGTYESYPVPTIDWRALRDKHGTPHFVKISIEGNETAFLEGMVSTDGLPEYISVKCRRLAPVEILHDLGYRHFKLVDRNWSAWRQASGPFGRDLPGEWVDFEDFKRQWLRADSDDVRIGFDCHAWFARAEIIE
jgi:FkbM family methyltransferase